MSEDICLRMEALLRHLKFTEPETQHWMNMGNVGRGAMNGFIDADTFRDDTTNQIKGLLLAVELLAKKCAYLEKQIK